MCEALSGTIVSCMSDIARPIERGPYNIAFYGNRNSLIVDRAIDFDPAMEPTEWQPPAEVVPKEQMEAYTDLCKLAVGTTSRVIYLPRETNYSRAVVYATSHGVVHHPSSAYLQVFGNNFKAGFGLGDMDFRDQGLAFHGTDQPWTRLDDHLYADAYITIEPGSAKRRYYNFSIGPKVGLVDRGGEYPTRVAPPDLIQEFHAKVLTPLEDDVKAQAYVWTGDPPTNPEHPERVV